MANIKNAVTAAAALSVPVGAVATVAVKRAKDKSYCPICSIKKAVNSVRFNPHSEEKYDNGVALTPPMGWSSWNLFRNKISEKLIKEIADAMKDSGLAEAGYRYINIDDCWQASERDEQGRLQADKVNFPGGIKSLCKYVNDKGLKLGIYSSNGTLTCEEYPASLRKEALDADTFASWGIEYFKYDFCHNEKIPSEAPKISAISFAREGEGEDFAVFTPEDVSLKGMAKVFKDEELESGSYIAGIDSHNGSFALDINVSEAGRYILTLTVKRGNNDAFVMLKTGGKEYHLYYPRTKNYTKEGRMQTTVELTEGDNHLEFSNSVGSKMDSAAIQYKLMGRELKRAAEEFAEKNGTPVKPIVYSICEWGLNRPHKWGAQAGNLWRTTPDIRPSWTSVMGIYEMNVRLDKYSAIGAWNDPDMLEVGNGSLTYEENKSHFSLWCMMSAPLILGNDIRNFIVDGKVDKDNRVYQILTNKDMISIDQDALGVQCKRIKTGIVDILVKPLKDSKVALCLLNKGLTQNVTRVDLKKIANLGFVNLPKKDSYKVYDVWEEKELDNTLTLNAVMEKHGVKVYIVE